MPQDPPLSLVSVLSVSVMWLSAELAVSWRWLLHSNEARKEEQLDRFLKGFSG